MSAPRLDDEDFGSKKSVRKDANAVDLDWQSFPATEPALAAPATSSPLAEPAVSSPTASGVNLEVADALQTPLWCVTPSSYYHLFDVTTQQVVERVKAALWPLDRTSFLTTLGNKPDFYGPLWIPATLVFVIGAASNLNSWLSFKPGTEAVSIWHYDFTLVTLALVSVFSFTVAVTTVLWFVAGFVGLISATDLPLIYFLCIQGYSVAVFIPAALLSILPSTGLQWTVAVAAAALSALFVFKSLFPVLARRNAATGGGAGSAGSPSSPLSAIDWNTPGMRIVVPVVVLFQLGFAALLKMEFFTK
jgi:hypothetical protein